MKRLVILVVTAAVLAAPVAAQSLSVLLPSLSFPEPVTTPSTMDCVPSATVICVSAGPVRFNANRVTSASDPVPPPPPQAERNITATSAVVRPCRRPTLFPAVIN